MDDEDIVYGLGESNRGINKRGFVYTSNCTDDPEHTEDKHSLYGAHNFIIVSGKETFGMFFDYPAAITFDIGYTRMDTMKVTCENADMNLYVIEGENPYDIVKQFRHVIGRSYIPPKFAFGFGQSRWGYTTKEDFREVAAGYRENHIPLDMIYMDTDYMQSYKDFTLNEENFQDFPEFVKELKDQNIRLIPIIDAGVKVEPGYDVYEEGVKNRYFCQREDGSDFVAAVWPGDTHFPDFLNKDARKWFGDKYRFLIEKGIDGFWNDMNEPAIFYSTEGMKEVKELAGEFAKDTEGKIHIWKMQSALRNVANNPDDYRRFYHNVDGKKIRHDKVHMKAALNDDMYFRPLGFVYPDDRIAVRVEDQLMLGGEIMIAPVYEQNARGRYVYLPEEMKFVKFLPDGTIAEEILEKGVHYVEVALNEIPLFIRKGKCIPVAETAECVAALDTENMQLLGYEGAEYTLYEDDGIHKDYDREENYRVLKK